MREKPRRELSAPGRPRVEARRWDANRAGGDRVRDSESNPAGPFVPDNRRMDNTSVLTPPGQVVSAVRVVRRVPLSELVERAAEARAERETIPFNSSI